MRYFNTLIQICSIGLFAVLCILTPPYISYCLLFLLFVRVFLFLRPTKGSPIKDYEKPQQALIVLDIQEAMCGENGLYPSNVSFIKEINRIIHDAQQNGQHIIFVRQEFHRMDLLFCLLIMGGRLLQGLKGTLLCSGMTKADSITLVKHQQDAFTS